MLPTAVTLRNYRSFAEAVHFEMRPVTLLYGVNNAGKSALLRALPLLADSVGAELAGPLQLESPAMRGGTFADLHWKGPIREDADPHLEIRFHWSDGPPPFRIDYVLEWFDERLIVRRLTIFHGDDPQLDAKWMARKEERSATRLSYSLGSGSSPVGIEFRGLLPSSEQEEVDQILEGARVRLRALRDRVQWIGATRRLPEARHGARPSGPRAQLRSDGEDVGAVLSTRPEVLSSVSAWYERNLDRRVVVEDVPPGSYRLMLENLGEGGFPVDFRDTGEGMVQVLSILTALALARRANDGGKILALEEPESHLHPSLQRALAEEICTVAASPVGQRPNILLETHSEHLLLGVQWQIVQEKIDPEDVLIYWVRQLGNGESVAEKIRLDSDARFLGGSLPPGVFSEDTEVAREIIRVRMDREKS